MIDFSRYSPQRMFLVQGDNDAFDEIVTALIKKDPLVQAMSVPRFTVEHAQNIAAFANEGTGNERTFIVHFSVFSPDAAQILLKSLEEPAANTTIIFVTRYPYLIPKTVRSRLMLLSAEATTEKEGSKKSVLDQIKKEASEKDDDAALRRARAIALLDHLEISARTDPGAACRIYEAKSMLFKANLPTKFILDYISTVVR